MPVAILLMALLAAASPSDTKRQTLARWYEGPVRYILTRREEKEFKALHDDVARSEFIRSFWRRRDPLPETPENEARISFWRRVVEANRLFVESSIPGWKTDRGKIYILIGPPTDIKEDSNYRLHDPNITGAGLILWIYEGNLNIPSLGGNFQLPFVRGNDGEWHLSSSSRLSNPTFEPLSMYAPDAAPVAKIQSLLDYGPSDLGMALDQGLLQQPPWQEKDLIDRVTSEAFLGALPLNVGFEFLRAADGSTFALINCAAPLSAFSTPGGEVRAAPQVQVLARLSPTDGGEPIDVGEASFAPSPTNAQAKGDDPLLYQARVPLRPGRYDLYIGLFERTRFQAANIRSVLEVPDMSGPLALSSIALGRSIRPLPEGAGGYNRPFRLSDFEFIPAVGGLFRTGQPFAALWQIYTTGPSGPGSGLQVTSRFLKIGEKGEETPVGKPRVIEDAEGVQGWSVELTGWPQGSYRFEVSVRDRDGRTAVRSAGFRVQ